MNRLIVLRWFCAAVSVAVFVLVIGCRDDGNGRPSAAGAGTGQQPKSTDPAEDEIQAERAKLSPEDRMLVDAQEWCVTSGERLGSMKAPIKLTVKDQPVFICCAGCRTRALADPDATLAQVQALKKKKADSSK